MKLIFHIKQWLTDTQVSKIRKAFVNDSSANMKISKTQLPKMIQSGGSFGMFSPIHPINQTKVLSTLANESEDLSKKETLKDTIKTVHISKNFLKDFKTFPGREITLANNEIKDNMKVSVIKSLEKRGILSKGTTTKTTTMKSARIPLAKSVLIPLGLSAGMSATDAAIQKKIYGSGTTALINSNEEMEDIMKIVK